MKRFFAMVLALIMLLPLAACGDKTTPADNDSINATEEATFSEFQWPDSEIASLLPIPESNIGSISWEASYGFVIYVGETSKEQYDAYVDDCVENGFTVDYNKGEDYYYADNESGYHLTLNYEGNNTMFVGIDEPDDTAVTNSVEEPSTESIAAPSTKPSTEPSVDGISPEFKEAMDSYEAFFDEYVEFMKKYQDSKDTANMLADYADYMTQYADTMEKMGAINEDELSAAETAYYLEVTVRITQKLAEIAQ